MNVRAALMVGLFALVWPALAGAQPQPPVPSPAVVQAQELQRALQQANDLLNRADFANALTASTRAVALAGQAGPTNPNLGVALLLLSRAYRELGRFAEAEPPVRRAVEIFERALGPENPNVATPLNNLAFLLEKQGRYAEAEAIYRRSLAIREKANGPRHPAVANLLNNIATLERNMGRYAEADELLTRALSILEAAADAPPGDIAVTANNLAEVMREQGKPDRAQPLYERALEIWRRTLGPDHPTLAVPLNNLAEMAREAGRYAEAEAQYKRVLAIREKALGLDHPDVAQSVNNLAALYRAVGRYAEAEALYKRSLAIRERVLGDGHPDVARTLNNLARVYRAQSRFGEAEAMFKRAQTLWERTIGPNHPDLGYSLDNLARMYRALGRYAEAETLFERTIGIWRQAFGEEHPTMARAFLHLGELMLAQGRFAEAEPLYERSTAMYLRLYGTRHPLVADSLYRFAELRFAEDRAGEALALARRATAIMRDRSADADADRGDDAVAEQRATRDDYFLHAALLDRVMAQTADAASREALTEEAVAVAQLAQSSVTARAVTRMAARFRSGDDALAQLVRRRQDLVEAWKRLDAQLSKSAEDIAERRDLAAEEQSRARQDALDREVDELDVRLAVEFPHYAELANPQPLPVARIQAKLGPGEKLVQYLVGESQSFVAVVDSGRATFLRLDIGREELSDTVAWLRQGLDPTLGAMQSGVIPEFDLRAAHELYLRIFAPIEGLLAGARLLFVVPDGALVSLPLGVLVARAPPDGGASYRQTAWVGWRYPMSTLPSVSSLDALRNAAREGRTTAGFLGIGEPVAPADGRLPDSLAGTVLQAQYEAVRALPSLPDSGDELRDIGNIFGRGAADLLLREQATKRNLVAAELDKYRVIAFATHGLVAGDLLGLTEPALVLTPELPLSTESDGLLTASEIAALKLNAEWVILSACNTAAGDGTPGADGLSGLAKAFFYAGSHSLLVSHWPVESQAAVRLTTAIFTAMLREPELGRAAALSRAMVDLAADPAMDSFAHPMFWAPFVVVGEGGAAW